MTWSRIFTSDEARIESKAGASPPKERPDWFKAGFDSEAEFLDYPMPVPPPPESFFDRVRRNGWPFPPKPPYSADDEALEVPE